MSLCSLKRVVYLHDTNESPLLPHHIASIVTLVSAKKMLFEVTNQVPRGCAAYSINKYCQLHLMVKGMVDVEAEVEKLTQKMEKLRMVKETFRRKIIVVDYEIKVKAEVRAGNDAKVSVESC